jgi:serine/threonine-protein kinase
VVSSDPAEGNFVQKGSHVRILVSSGPEQVVVPSVVGQDAATAHSNLLQDTLKYTDQQQFSDTVPKGQVISQSPVAGGKVDKDSRVTLTISKGADLTNAPDVAGLTQSAATAQIQAAGLKVQAKQLTVTDQAQDGMVVRQRPAPGTQLKKGRTVVIYIGHFTNPGTGGGNTTPPTTP